MKIRKRLAQSLHNLLPEQIYSILKKPIRFILGPTCVHMLREDLNDILPLKSGENTILDLNNAAIRLNSGQKISLFKRFHAELLDPQKEYDYIQVMRMSMKEDADEKWFKENYSNDKDYDPKHLIMIYQENIPVAAAGSWHTVWKKQNIGLIHNVGVHKNYRRLGLGRIITTLALLRLKNRGFTQALLATEDYRIPAISLYLSLGFRPVFINLFHKRRWEKILNKTIQSNFP